MVTDELKYVWAYLLKYGDRTNGKWCIYTGYEPPDGEHREWSYEKILEKRASFERRVLEIGIDWSKTKVPTTTSELEFMDTYNGCKDVTVTIGELFLKDGSKHFLGTDDSSVSGLVELAQKSLLGSTEVDDLASKI